MSSTPPRPPPDDSNWLGRFDRLAISTPQPSSLTNSRKTTAPFVGGFSDRREKPLPAPPPPPPFGGGFYTLNPSAIPPPPVFPNPTNGGNGVRMPEPQSLTMQYAVAGNTLGLSPPLRPHGAPSPPDARPQSAPEVRNPTPVSAVPAPSPASPESKTPSRKKRPSTATPSGAPALSPRAKSDTATATPVTPPKRRGRRSSAVNSTPGTPSDGSSKVQCSGQKVNGERCGRLVKSTALDGSSDDDGNTPLAVYCHQHRKSMVTSTTFFARKNGHEVKFADWIPKYLHPDTQIALRAEMEKSRSASEEDGYIYAFQILDPDDPNTVHMKVGRTTKLTQRIHQWSKQCGSKEQVLRGFWPSSGDTTGEDGDVGASLLKGRVQAGAPGPCSHRLERLIHLELADLVANTPYRDPDWKDLGDGEEGTASPPRNLKSECPDCGAMHKEIFSLPRIRTGGNRRREWESVVQPVIERWGRFVELYV